MYNHCRDDGAAHCSEGIGRHLVLVVSALTESAASKVSKKAPRNLPGMLSPLVHQSEVDNTDPEPRLHPEHQRGGTAGGIGLDHPFLVCSTRAMEEGFKIVRTNGGDELVARIGNYEICKAAFEKAIFVYPNDHLEAPRCEGHLEIEGV
jgi:hypothetical protein